MRDEDNEVFLEKIPMRILMKYGNSNSFRIIAFSLGKIRFNMVYKNKGLEKKVKLNNFSASSLEM